MQETKEHKNRIKQTLWVMGVVLLFLGVIALLHPSCERGMKNGAVGKLLKIDDAHLLVNRVKSCSRIYTMEMTLHKIFVYNNESIVGNRSIAIPMNAVVKAYIDLSKLKEENIFFHEGQIEVILPDPQWEIVHTKIIHSEIVERVTFLRPRFSDEELSYYTRLARQEMEASLADLHLEKQACESAAKTLIPFIQHLGYKEENIRITFRKDWSSEDLLKSLNSITMQ